MAGKARRHPGFFAGLRAYGEVPRTLFRHRLWPFLLLPSTLSVILTFGVLGLTVWATMELGPWLEGRLEFSWAWVERLVAVGAQLLVLCAAMVAFVFLHKRLILIFLAPLLGKLAERTLERTEPESGLIDPLPFWPSVRRGIGVNLSHVFRELALTLFLLVGGLFLPGIGSVLTTPLIFLIQARYLGSGLADFPLEHRRFNARESLAFTSRRKALMTGLGTGYLLLMLIPVVGWALAPTFGTVAGTLLASRELRVRAGAAAA